jgi:peptidyl-prolyl cis-trans isomerase B (cyclophilin B)
MFTIKTNLGEIKVKLDKENTPKTAENFEEYVKSDFFNGTIFHRIIDGFMVQCGGFEPGMQHKSSGIPIENEADKGGKNKRGTLAMARTSDPHSASSQFFINVADNAFLDFKSKDMNGWGYCVFGEVLEGMDIVDKMKAVKTTSRSGHQDVPVEDVLITEVLEA